MAQTMHLPLKENKALDSNFLPLMDKTFVLEAYDEVNAKLDDHIVTIP